MKSLGDWTEDQLVHYLLYIEHVSQLRGFQVHLPLIASELELIGRGLIEVSSKESRNGFTWATFRLTGHGKSFLEEVGLASLALACLGVGDNQLAALCVDRLGLADLPVFLSCKSDLVRTMAKARCETLGMKK